jgi:membrane-anchored glycerophosphoryl diester phosphodiesterase (GDPDase)
MKSGRKNIPDIKMNDYFIAISGIVFQASKSMLTTVNINGPIHFLRSRSFHYQQYLMPIKRSKTILVTVLKRLQCVSAARLIFLVLPSLSIPFSELSLSALLGLPVIIPSPIGMELFEVTSGLIYSFSLSRIQYH